MTGHPTPRRTAARPSAPPSRRPHPILVPAVLLLALLLLVTGASLLAGCGSETPATTQTTSPAATASTTPATSDTSTTAAPTETTASTVAQPAEGTFPVTVKDDNGNSVTLDAKPMRIVSTAPASTELLFALGVGDRVVGVTSLDDYPPDVAAIVKVGDFQANTEAVMALSPDLVIGYSGNEEALAPVEAAGAAVLILNPMNLEQIYANIETVGAATGATGKAAEVVDAVKAQIKEVTDGAGQLGLSPKVFYALDNTLWTAGPGSFVDELLKLVGATNVGSMQGSDSAAAQAYYQFAPEQLIAADPDVILLPNTAYKSVDEFVQDARFAQLAAVKQGHVYLINDVIITRPGPRIGEGLKTLFEAVRPGVRSPIG
jgi:iron complex transport system substrate-binding protein